MRAFVRIEHIVVVVGILAVGLTAPAFGRTPAPKPCDDGAEQQALGKAQRIFPKAALRSIRCQYWGDSMHTSFAQHELPVRQAGIRFIVDGKAVQKRRKGVVGRPLKPSFFLVPFDRRASLVQAANQIRRNSVVRRAFGKQPLFCLATAGLSGTSADYTCGIRPMKRETRTLLGLAPVVRLRQILTRSENGLRREAVRMVGFALPASKLAPGTARWAEARKQPRVAAHLRRYRRAVVVVFERWQRDYVSIVPLSQPDNKVVVVWDEYLDTVREGNRLRQVAKAAGIARVCRTAKAADCVLKVLRKDPR